MYVVNGVFASRAPEHVDSTIDLHGGFIVPPFGDAHTHNLDGTFRLDTAANMYLREGTFYVQVLTNTATGAAEVRARFNHPGTLDVAYANGGLTETLGHPFEAYEPRHIGIFSVAQANARLAELCASRTLEGNAYWFLDSAADVARAWPRILAAHPDIIKIFLVHSETYHPSLTCGDAEMGNGGLSPALVPDIVQRAHAARLRVWAHIESAYDFRVAALAGVDGFAHVPGYDLRGNESATPYEVSDADAAVVGKHGAVMTPTAGLAAEYAHGDTLAYHRIQDIERRNLRVLQHAGVRVVVGSDYYGRTAAPEVEALRALDLWNNAQLLRMWAVETPRAIFPGRAIGELRAGDEASLLALQCDPTLDFACTHHIGFRMKQGVPVALGGT